MRQLRELTTEQANPATEDLDGLDALGIVTRLNAQDAGVAAAVAAELPAIAWVAECAAASFAAGGRLIYVGAGTSGRLGVLDAAECPPTFGSDPEQVVGLIAGGAASLVASAEGVEDDAAAGAADLAALAPGPADTVVGISASHRTPYTVAAVEAAVRSGCRTAFITANPEVAVPGERVIRLLVGPEALAGSTRLKAGTAQKLALNLISTAAWVLAGKVYGNRMVDLQAASEKLRERARGLLVELAGLDYAAASALLEAAGGSVKTALCMQLGGCSRAQAQARLAAAGGQLRRALAVAPPPGS
ncbi:N-acetylmuramic acid 6-phosphate etherase [bacterium]|nr:N-acetylmuramic acid 6-phosphate etherase [bacterium]